MPLQQLFETTTANLFNGDYSIEECQAFINALQKNLNSTKIKITPNAPITTEANTEDKAE